MDILKGGVDHGSIQKCGGSWKHSNVGWIMDTLKSVVDYGHTKKSDVDHGHTTKCRESWKY